MTQVNFVVSMATLALKSSLFLRDSQAINLFRCESKCSQKWTGMPIYIACLSVSRSDEHVKKFDSQKIPLYIFTVSESPSWILLSSPMPNNSDYNSNHTCHEYGYMTVYNCNHNHACTLRIYIRSIMINKDVKHFRKCLAFFGSHHMIPILYSGPVIKFILVLMMHAWHKPAYVLWLHKIHNINRAESSFILDLQNTML